MQRASQRRHHHFGHRVRSLQVADGLERYRQDDQQAIDVSRSSVCFREAKQVGCQGLDRGVWAEAKSDQAE